MATIVLQGGTLVVRFNDGTTRSSGVAVNASMSEAEVQTAIGRAKNVVSAQLYGAGDDAHGDEARNASGNAAAIVRQLHPETRTPDQPREQRVPPPQREPRRTTPQPRQDEQRDRTTTTTRSQTPRPTITQEWLETQLREARRDDRRALAAATSIYTNRNFIDQYLSPETQRGVARTENQKNITITTFNTLYQIPAFRLYLSSLAAMRRDAYPDEIQRLHLPAGSTMPLYPEYVALQTFLTEPGRTESLAEQASAEIIRSADVYIRHFLLIFAAPNQLNARYHQEIEQMNIGGDVVDLGWRLRNVQGAMTFTPANGRGPTDADRAALARLYISGPMDADTLAASVLFIRRWTQEHPERGRARTQDQISLWQVPQAIPRDQTPQQVQPTEVRPTVQTAQIPRIAIAGDSILAGGRAGTTLQSSLQPRFQGASVTTFAHVGDPLSTIRTQLRQQVLNANPPFNTVIIEGGINGMAGTSVEDSERVFTTMISEARQRGLRVILLTVTPWGSYSGSTTEAQRRTRELNQWLRGQGSGNDVIVVDTSPIGEGSPPHLKRQFDSGDGLHPNDAGRDQIAALVAQAAYGISATQEQRRNTLQDFADRNWATLTSELFRHVSSGNPEGVVAILRNKPEGTASVEDALHSLNREDIARTFDRVFNEFMRQDTDFTAFCRGRREYEGIAREGVSLSASSDASARRLVVRAMQDYLNYEASRTGQDWYGRLRDDLRLLYRQVLSTNRDDMNSDATEDLRTLSALAVYSWRKAHQSDAVGAWGPNLNLRLEQQRQQVVAPPPPPPPPPPEGQRRRAITP